MTAAEDSVHLIFVFYNSSKTDGSEMKKKKLNGWILIGICFGAMAAAVGVLYAIGQMG